MTNYSKHLTNDQNRLDELPHDQCVISNKDEGNSEQMSHGYSGQLVILPVEGVEKLKSFVQLPYKIYASNPNWPGQDDAAEMALHNPETNYPLRYLDTRLFIAELEGEVVGRISVNINELHNKVWNQNIGFFGHFECINDQRVANALLETAEKWIRERGKDEIHGPFSYTYYDIIGICVQGYDKRPTIGLTFNPSYYRDLIENFGYSQVKDVVEVLAPVELHYNIMKEKIAEVQHLEEDHRFTIRTIDPDRVREELLVIRKIYLDCFTALWAIRPLDEEEWLAAMEGSFPIMPSELFLIVEDQGEPVAFLFHVDDYNEVLYNQRHGINDKIRRIKAYGIGSRKDYQKSGLGKWMSVVAAERMYKMGYNDISFSWIDADNHKSLSLSTGMGGTVDKIYRIYAKKF